MPPPGNGKELGEPRKVYRKCPSFFFFVVFLSHKEQLSLHFPKSASWRSQQRAAGGVLVPRHQAAGAGTARGWVQESSHLP